MLIDTHAHLFWDSFKQDFDQVLNDCLEAGVTTAINVGVDTKLSAVAARLESDKLKFYSSIGIHPHEATKYFTTNPDGSIAEDIAILEKIYEEYPDKVKLVGECGLDYFFHDNPGFEGAEKVSNEEIKDMQKRLLQGQIDLAKKLNLPLTIHCRDDRSQNPEEIEAWSDCLEMVKNHFGILHCYSGTMDITKKAFTETEFLFSFAGNITYKNNEYLREAIRFLPLERIVLETDCPFLAPQSIRGQRNTPASVKEIAELIAELKGISFAEVAEQTTKNVNKLLQL